MTDVQKKQADLVLQFYPLMQTAQLYETLARIDNYMSDTKLNQEQVTYLKAQKSLIRSQIQVNRSQIQVNRSQVGLNNANAGLAREKAKTEKNVRENLDSGTNVNNAQEAKIYTEQEGQEIQNEVDRKTVPAQISEKE